MWLIWPVEEAPLLYDADFQACEKGVSFTGHFYLHSEGRTPLVLKGPVDSIWTEFL